MKTKAGLGLLLSFVFLCGCRTIADTRAVAPDWVTSAPRIENMICAVGTSDPTFFPEDAKQYAAENARKELARVLNIEIKTIMVDIASDKGGSVDEATVTEVSSWASFAVVENSQIMGCWHDATGSVSQKKNITYALCCMPKKFNRADLETRLTSGKSTPEDISRSVTQIIDKLEEKK